MIEIQKRDLEILACCQDQQFLTHGHVQRFFFKGAHERKARERVRELEGVGLLTQVPLRQPGQPKIIRLTKQGLGLIEEKRQVRVNALKVLNLNTLEHDAIVTSVRLRLAEFWDATWIPEQVLKASSPIEIPDGIFSFPSGAQVMVEVENSRKDRPRFHRLLERWRDVQPMLVLYVATSPALFREIKSWIEDGPQDLPIGLVEWGELETGEPLIWTQRGELALLSQRTLP
jgi:hypothetical protein